jgi:hypothetical protein
MQFQHDAHLLSLTLKIDRYTHSIGQAVGDNLELVTTI